MKSGTFLLFEIAIQLHVNIIERNLLWKVLFVNATPVFQPKIGFKESQSIILTETQAAASISKITGKSTTFKLDEGPLSMIFVPWKWTICLWIVCILFIRWPFEMCYTLLIDVDKMVFVSVQSKANAVNSLHNKLDPLSDQVWLCNFNERNLTIAKCLFELNKRDK